MDLKVLHSIEEYLLTTQNWIYPQITRVPAVEPAVLCRFNRNPREFPLHGVPIFSDWTHGNKAVDIFLRRVSNTVWPFNRAEAQACSWAPDLIHAHFGVSGWRMLGLVRRIRRPLVTTFYGYDAWSLPVLAPYWSHRFRSLFHSGDLFLVEGPAMKQRLIDLGCDPSKVRIRTLGVDLPRLKFATRSVGSALRILMVGRFIPKKGLVDGLRACAIASAAGVELTVTIVGDAGNNPTEVSIKSELLRLAADPVLAGRVTLRGFLSVHDTFETLKSHNVLLCPSRHSPDGDAEGGLPYVLTEAMALGLLCIGSRHCDIPEAIIDGTTGFSFEEGNIEELGRLIVQSAELGPKLESIQLNARSHVEQKYSQEIQLGKLSEIYKETVHTYSG